jgi:hypothetical protein
MLAGSTEVTVELFAILQGHNMHSLTDLVSIMPTL